MNRKQKTPIGPFDWIQEQLGASIDIVNEKLQIENYVAQLFYIKSIADEKKISNMVIKPFFEMLSIVDYEQYLYSLPEHLEYKNEKDTLHNILRGTVALYVNNQVILLDLKNYADSSVGEAMIETVIQGPQNALNENLGMNLNMIRNRYHQSTLRILKKECGTISKSQVLLIYDERLVKQPLLKDIQEKLDTIDIEMLQSTGQIVRHFSKQKRSLFPTMLLTERPDRIAYNLSKGKIVILLEGSTFALILPSIFYDFISSMEDFNHSYWISRFIIIIRYTGLFISVILPALYLAIVAYNPEILRIQLTFSISGSRANVPYPTFVEMLILLIVMEMLIEASIRLPKSIGSTATTVGGLILGQAASQAGLVSNIMIIIVAAVAISNFVIPINEMSFAIRVVKYLLFIFAIFFGLIGLIIGFIGLVIYLCNLDSFGKPYLKLFMFSPNDNGSKT